MSDLGHGVHDRGRAHKNYINIYSYHVFQLSLKSSQRVAGKSYVLATNLQKRIYMQPRLLTCMLERVGWCRKKHPMNQ